MDVNKYYLNTITKDVYYVYRVDDDLVHIKNITNSNRSYFIRDAMRHYSGCYIELTRLGEVLYGC